MPSIEENLNNSKKQIIATFFLTKSVKETAETLNYSYHWVYQVLRSFDIICKTRKKTSVAFKQLNHKKKLDIATAYQNGMPVNHIRCKFNISNVVLYLVISELNISKRYNNKSLNWNQLPEEIKAGLMAEVLILNSLSMPYAQIARELKLPLSRVRNLIENKEYASI